MAISIGGNTVKNKADGGKVTYNGKNVSEVLYNGVHVWPDAAPSGDGDIAITISNIANKYNYYMTLSLPDSNGHYFTLRNSKTLDRPYTYGINFDSSKDYKIYCVGTLVGNMMSSNNHVDCRIATSYPVSTSSTMYIGGASLDFTYLTPYGLLVIFWNAIDKKWYLERYETEASLDNYTGIPGMTLRNVNFRLIQTMRMPDGYIQGAYKHGVIVEPTVNVNNLNVYMTPKQLFTIDEEA